MVKKKKNIFPGSSVGKESIWNAGDPGLTPRSERTAREGIGYPLQYSWATLVAQLIKNTPAMWETWVLLTQGLSQGSSYWRGCSHEKACPRLDTWQISASSFQVPSVPFHVASSQGPLSLLLDMATPSKWWSKSEQGESQNAIYELVSDVRHHQSHHILFTKCELLSPSPPPAASKGGKWASPFEGRTVKEFAGIFNTGVGFHTLLQGIFPIQGLNPSLLHYRWILLLSELSGEP